MITCIEGINGSGKTTLARALVEGWPHGRAAAIDPVQHTTYGQAVRAVIMAADGLTADSETLAFASARLHTAGILAPARCPPAGEMIILERWAGAVVAYGTVAGASPFLLRALEAALTGALPADVTVLLDAPGEIAEARVTRLGDRNRFETQGAGYLERVRRQYLAWASIRQIPVINGLQDPATVARQVSELIRYRAAASGILIKESA
jgi:dTMP kinase